MLVTAILSGLTPQSRSPSAEVAAKAGFSAGNAGTDLEMNRHSTQISHSRMRPASHRLSHSRTICSSMIVTLP